MTASVSQITVVWLLFVAVSWVEGADGASDLVVSMAVVTPIFVFASMLLRQVYVVEDGGAGELPFRPFLNHRLVAASVALITCFSIAALAGDRLPRSLVLAVAFYKASESVAEILLAPAHAMADFRRIALVVSLRSLACATAGPLFVIATGEAWTGFGCAGAWILGSAFAWPGYLKRFGFLERRKRHDLTLLALTRRSVPLAGVATLVAVEASVPRYFLALSVSDIHLAQFGAAGYLLTGANTVGLAVSQVMLPNLSRQVASGRALTDSVARASRYLGMGGALIVLASAVVPVALLEFVYGPEVAPGRGLLMAVAVATLARLWAEPWRSALRASGRYNYQLRLQFLSSFVLAAALVPLVSLGGTAGAALAMGLAAVAMGLGTRTSVTTHVDRPVTAPSQ